MAIYNGIKLNNNLQDGTKDYKTVNRLGAYMGRIIEFPNRFPRDNIVNKMKKATKTF